MVKEMTLSLRMKVTGPSGAIDVRSVPRLALAVESGSSSTPFVKQVNLKPAGRFLHLESRSRIYFPLVVAVKHC